MAYKPDVQTWLTINNEATLANERALAVSNNINKVDGGAGSTLTLQTFKTTNVSGTATLTTASNTSQYGDATSAAFAITLPAAASSTEKMFLFKKIDSSVNAVTVTRAGSDTIDGATTYVLSAQYDWLIIQSDGTANWKIVGRNFSSSGAPTGAQYLTLATDGTLTSERVFTPDTNLFATDAGAGSTYTVQTMKVSSVSGNTTLTSASNTVQLVDDSSGTVTMTLPTASTCASKVFLIKKKSASNTTVIARAASDTIDGQTSFTMSGQYDAIHCVSDGTNWFLF